MFQLTVFILKLSVRLRSKKHQLKIIKKSVSGTETVNVKFARSNKTTSWDATQGSILELAEANGIVNIIAGCRAGNCDSCITAIMDGEVKYLNPPGSPAEDGSCHTCISVPKSDIVIDA